MFGLSSVYLFLIACHVTLIKFFREIYFSSKNYNKSLETKTPQQIYYNPNPFLLSIITTYNGHPFRVNDINPNIFWIEDKKKDTEQMHSFFWLSLLDRKTDQSKLKKIIYIWMLKNSKYKKNIWQTSTLSARIISWILNVDIILNNSTFEFRKNFLSCIISQTNHLKRNIRFENDLTKKIEILTAIILTGLVFKEYQENFDIGIKELESLVKDFFNNDGFPLSRNPNDLIFFSKYLIFCKEVIKDSQRYVPEFLEDIINKNLNCIHYLKTPDEQLPLFNGASNIKLNQIKRYLDEFKPNNKNNNLGGLYRIKHKNHFLIIDIDKPPKKKFSKSYQSGPLSFEYYLDGIKIITNSGYGGHISKKATLISRLTACQSTLNINDTSITSFEKKGVINKVFGDSIQNTFKSFEFFSKDEDGLVGCSASNNGYEKKFGCTHKREIYVNKENNYLKGVDHIFKAKDGYPIKYTFRFYINPDLSVVKTMSGNSALIQISKNKSLIFNIIDENLEVENSIFLGGKKIIDHSCITFSGNLVNKNKTFNWEIRKNI